MPSKLDLLRNGQSVEFEPGVTGRLNRDKKTLELSTGEVLNAAHDRDLFPENEHGLNVSRKKETLQGNIKKPGGEFWHQLSTQGPIGGVSDAISYFTQKGGDYAASKQADQEISQQISKESPWTSRAATAASFIGDMAVTRGLPAFKAAPALTALSKGSELITDPTQSAIDVTLAAAGGKFVDNVVGKFNEAAARRGQVRALPGQQQAVKQQNIIGKQQVAEQNALQTQQHNALTQNVKNSNMANVQQRQQQLIDRQNRIIEMQNKHVVDKAATDAEVLRLKNKADNDRINQRFEKASSDAEYKLALKNADEAEKRFAQQFKLEEEAYKKELKNMPQAQAKAQKEYSENVIKNAEEISNAFPQTTRIYTDQFGIQDFINDTIQKSSSAGTPDSNRASKILLSLFPEGEILTSKELAARYRSLEGAIQKNPPGVKKLLNEFKTHMGDRLSPILADSMAYEKVIPSFQKLLTGHVHPALKKKGFAPNPNKRVFTVLDTIIGEMKDSVPSVTVKANLLKRAHANANQFFRELTPQKFIEKFQSGQLKQDLLNKILNKSDFEINFGQSTRKAKVPSMSIEEFEKLGIPLSDPSAEQLSIFQSLLEKKLDPLFAKMQMKMIGVEADAAKRLGTNVRKTYGIAGEVQPPSPPIRPEPVSRPSSPDRIPEIPNPDYPPQPVMPGKPPLPPNAQFTNPPIAPPKNTFIPQAEPVLAPARTMAEGAGDLLERNIMGGKGLVNNPITKLAGLKYVAGQGALPIEAAYLAAKGLTSPTAGGEVARMTFKQAGIEAIQNWASQYPSYHDGILESPQDRRSLTKEVEDAYDIPLEQKAVIQSKINRGKPLQERL